MNSYRKSNELVICVRLMLTSLLSIRWHYDSLIKKDTNNAEFDDRPDSYVRCDKIYPTWQEYAVTQAWGGVYDVLHLVTITTELRDLALKTQWYFVYPGSKRERDEHLFFVMVEVPDIQHKTTMTFSELGTRWS